MRQFKARNRRQKTSIKSQSLGLRHGPKSAVLESFPVLSICCSARTIGMKRNAKKRILFMNGGIPASAISIFSVHNDRMDLIDG